MERDEFSKPLMEFKYRLYRKLHYSTKGNLDLEIPSPRLRVEGLKIAVYSCITNEYESVIEPLHTEPGIDYYMFTDGDCSGDSKWKRIDITRFEEYKELSPVQLNRRIKILPFRYLSGYDYSIYVYGNIEIVAPLSPLVEEMGNHAFGVHYHRTRDCIFDELVQVLHLKKTDSAIARSQIENYKREGFPRHFGLYENSILIRKHNDEEIRYLMETWWEEYMRYPTRDQLSLPYVMWKSGYDRRKIHIIGRNLEKSPRFNRIQHRKI